MTKAATLLVMTCVVFQLTAFKRRDPVMMNLWTVILCTTVVLINAGVL